jgi:uncharacterized protein (TIGR02118 family)
MNACLFLSFAADCMAGDEQSGLNRLLGATPRLIKALIHTPSSAKHPYTEEGSLPGLVLQLYFANLPDLEASLSRNGHLQVLGSRTEFPALSSVDTTEQAMLVRTFDVAVPGRKSGSEAHCSYLVSYEGEADDLNAWHSHYLESHTRCIAMLPGVRELEVYTRLDWVSASSWRRVNYMQRNRVAFDNVDGLEAALSSPAREAIRADVRAFPAFTGPTRHVAMLTRLMKP